MILRSFSVILAVLLLMPLGVLLFQTDQIEIQKSALWLPVLGNTLLQAFFSAMLSLLLGGIGALGLLGVSSSRWERIFRSVALFPGFLPPLLVLSSVFLWADHLGWEPRGLGAVIFFHVLINGGICSVAITDLITDKLGTFTNVTKVLGAGHWHYYRWVALPLLKWDLLYIFTMVLALCVTSFSIPLMVGSADISLEVLIYENMKIGKDWNQALTMTLVQILVIFLLFYPLQKSKVHRASDKEIVSGYGWLPGVFLLAICAALCSLGLFWGVQGGLSMWVSVAEEFTPEFFKALEGTLRITSMTSLFVFLFLNIAVIDMETGWLHKLLSGYLAPSPVIVGFSLWSLSSNTFWLSEIKISLGLALVFLPALYRWRAASVILSLKGQVQAARSMGAGALQIFRWITFPQTVSATSWLAGVAAFWASGDFVLATILGFGHSTLGILVESLLASYQWELAALISLIIFVLGGSCLAVLGGLGRVLGSKPLP